MPSLADFIHRNRDEIVELWADKISVRLSLDSEARPQLINDVPEILIDLVEALQKPPEQWPATSSRSHAHNRISLGVDIGGLSEEIVVIGETVLEVAADQQVEVHPGEAAKMFRLLARGCAESVTEYARLRDQERSKHAARHFSFVAHELRTPLQTARLAADVLEQTAGSPITDRLGRALRELSRLIDDSLVEARFTAEPSLRTEPVTVQDLVAEAVEQGEGLAAERGIQLKLEVPDLVLEVDRRLMASALTNLVINGVKFSRSGTTVKIVVAEREDRVHFEVYDACGGLSEDAMPKLFEPFGQAGEDRTGFGLGLLIVKQAVELHGGQVRVQNQPGHGCCFVLELPKHRSRSSVSNHS